MAVCRSSTTLLAWYVQEKKAQTAVPLSRVCKPHKPHKPHAAPHCACSRPFFYLLELSRVARDIDFLALVNHTSATLDPLVTVCRAGRPDTRKME